MTTYGALLTTAGANKLAAAASGGPAVTLTQVAVGDANGTPYVPNQAQTSLVDELYRATIASVGYVSPGTIEIVATIPANTADGSGRASGGWQILEMGLFDSTGTLFAVANTPAIYKPLPSSGAAADLTVRMVLVIGTAASVAVTVDSAHAVTLDRLDRMPFIAVDSATTTAPPSSPEIGATYLIPYGASGVWAGQTNNIAHWNGAAWVIITPYVGTVVGIGSNLNYEAWNGTAWVPLILSGPVVNLTTTTTLSASQLGGTILVDATAGNVAVTLPAAASPQAKAQTRFFRIDQATAHTVNLLPAGADLAQPGALTAAAMAIGSNPCLLLPGETLELSSDGVSNWYGAYIGPRRKLAAYGPGTSSLVVPPFKMLVGVSGWAGGGAGGTGIASGSGGGGGSGAHDEGDYAVVPGTTITITVGAAGVGAVNANGGTGGSTTISVGATALMTLTGGIGGSEANGGVAGNGGAGGTASGGRLGSKGNGNSGSSGTLTPNYVPGYGAPAVFGGAGTFASVGNGIAGFGPAGGGTGTANSTGSVGGSGAAGLVLAEI